jgi:GWxTD domain-containing protein
MRQTVFFLALMAPGAWCVAPGSGLDAPALPFRSTGTLLFFADVCQFEGHDATTAAEIVYAVDLSQVQGEQSAADAAVLLVDLLLQSPDGATLTHLHDRNTIPFSRDKPAGLYSFVDLKRLDLDPGLVTLQLSIRDSVSNKSGLIRDQIAVRKFPDAFSISDLMLSAQLQRAKSKSAFEKGGLIVVPMPSRSFSVADSLAQLFVYFEINHLHYAPQEPSTYDLLYDVHDAEGNNVFTASRSKLPKTGANSSRIEKIPVANLKPGRYRLSMRVLDLAASLACTARVDFSCTGTNAEEPLVLPMTAADAQKYFDQIKFLATDQEKEIYWQLSAAGKQNFVLGFWKSKDPTPGTPENEFMMEHFRRLAYCEKKFAGGLNSDMARIYVKYGAPMEVSREASAATINRPVEVWTYALDGRREFVFVDRTRDGHYVLVHSNHPGEYSNPDWADDYKN